MIVFVHLLNDRSGSPRVLKSAIESLPPDERQLLFLGSQGNGHLDNVNINTQKYWYHHSKNRIITLFSYAFSQIALFASLLRTPNIDKDAVIYVNTLLPFGAALYGRVTGRRVVFHVHEISIAPSIFRQFLVLVAKLTATRLIYVSDTHRHLLPIMQNRSVTVYNTVDFGLATHASRHQYLHRPNGIFTVLMLASARPYKGISEFMQLAEANSARTDIAFHLVLADSENADTFSHSMPRNVTVLPSTADPHAHYSNASLVLNLSRPDLWVETFGLTLLEGMAFGIPVIAPPVGGPAELITDGREGFLIDSRDGARLTASVEQLADDEDRCMQMSQAARMSAARFSHEAFRDAIAKVIKEARA
jgi:glycosyltransferase involved in cell wall biosynthesis